MASGSSSKSLQSRDKSDQKTISNLMDSLRELQKNANKQSPKSSKSQSPSTSRRSDNRKRKVDENHPKITTWLSRASRKKTPQLPKPLDIKKRRKETKFERTPSFEKYGVAMPSFEKIMEDHRKLEEHKKQVRVLLDNFEDDILVKSVNNDCLQETKTFSGEILDCKDLELGQLGDFVKKYMPMLKEIQSGERFSDRHQRYHNSNRKDLTSKYLRCSPSLVVFSQEQIDHMLKLMRFELDPEDKLSNYFFQVLLPELCLWIFMETHNMSQRKANQYLNERPLDI